MKLAIIRVADRGVREKERLRLKVVNDTNLTYYVVISSRYGTPNSVESEARQSYWFPPRAVKAGDVVILYTKSGKSHQQRLEDGTTKHFFYWGGTGPRWTQTGDCAVVMEVSDWQTSAYE